MGGRVRLLRVSLSYADGMVLQTASSGVVPALDELRLVVEQEGVVVALGATRLNIEYLSGMPPEVLCGVCVDAFDAVDWRTGGSIPEGLPAPARMLFEMASADRASRLAGVPMAVWLGGAAAAAVPSNQTLFLSDDATMLRRAQAYVTRGFLDLKLRVGAGPVADDIRRLNGLRTALGSEVRLAADANGSWSAVSAPAVLGKLAALGLDYIEQPIASGDWDAVACLSRSAPLPVMLDESLADLDAVATMIRTRAAPLAHLKLAKLGGLDRMMQAGRALGEAEIGVMVGQMNEGVVSTLAAAHAAVALRAVRQELYGADGLADDGAGMLAYDGGVLHLPPGPGLGLVRHDSSGALLRESVL